MSTSPPVRYRESTLRDYDGIKASIERCGLWMVNREEWLRRWPANPFRPPETPGGDDAPTGWVMERTDNAQIVGYFGNIYSGYELDGRPIRAAATHAVGVEPEYRGQSVPLLIRFFRQPHVQLLLTTTANEKAAKVWQGLGMARVPHPSYDQVLYWVTGPSRFTAAALRSKKVPAAGVMGPLLGAGVRLAERMRQREIRASPPVGVGEAHAVEWFDERFERFWQKQRTARPGRLLAVRSQEALQWHYHDANRLGNLRIVVIEEGDGLAGFAILMRRESAELKLRITAIVDMQISRDEPALVRTLLAGALKTAQGRGADVVEAIGLDAFKRGVLESLRPRVRSYPCWPYLFKVVKSDLIEPLKSPAAWDPCPYDGDSAF